MHITPVNANAALAWLLRDPYRCFAEIVAVGRRGAGGWRLEAVAVARRPFTWPRIRGHFRRYLLHRFPYGLIYAIHEDAIYVVAVMRLKRKPG